MTNFAILHLFGGLGGGALGFQRARASWHGLEGQFTTVCGVDVAPEACRDFEALTGSPAVLADIATMSAEELRAACPEPPAVVFMSPPCKGFSGLLPSASAGKEKYQALNRLVLQGLFLVLKAWPRPPKLVLLENVPRITSRGAHLLLQAKQLLGANGYLVDDRTHDCGELGGLAQHRRRYLLLARHQEQLPTFVHHPPIRRVRAVGEVLGDLPLPDDPDAGPLHRLPRLQWRTWVRLALIPAGGDWRDLPAAYQVHHDARRPLNNVWRVVRWEEPAGAVTAGSGPSSSGTCVADPRLEHQPRRGAWKVVSWGETAPTVTGAARVGESCAYAVQDPRLSFAPGRHFGKMRVESWMEPSHTIIGSDRVGSGAPSVGDPRLTCAPRTGTMGIIPWDEPARTVTGTADVHQGPAAVADPRVPADQDRPDPPPVIIAADGTWHRPLTTLELAALQGLPVRMQDGSPLHLAGGADRRWRERIGNAVPPHAAQAIAEALLASLLPASAGAEYALGSGGIWVRREELIA